MVKVGHGTAYYREMALQQRKLCRWCQYNSGRTMRLPAPAFLELSLL
jgi:hypothetical protein